MKKRTRSECSFALLAFFFPPPPQQVELAPALSQAVGSGPSSDITNPPEKPGNSGNFSHQEASYIIPQKVTEHSRLYLQALFWWCFFVPSLFIQDQHLVFPFSRKRDMKGI